MILFQVSTTFLGADSPTQFYFDCIGKAESYLDNCINGEITKMSIAPCGCLKSLNYWDGCTLNDLCYGNFGNINVIEVD